ncbi:nucleotide exchange factor GrpE [Halorhodospira neutriphila]|uniref:Protein GrpE n=1 Tax=Halorhodospira neutriphila TaxID=168379 RepID=A0ABS1E1H4_9GAMM|nr:nucleotide exchange factor GrpE [Halorhodospira neutriphila]MBK1725551.1 nucleotide exchange factor GrpE [Halorhodospira neutriphila]
MSEEQRQRSAEESSGVETQPGGDAAPEAEGGAAAAGAGQGPAAGAEAGAEAAEGGQDSAEAGAEDPEALRQRIGELESALSEAQSQAQSNWDQVLRLRAELENAQRRAQKDVEQAKRQGLEKVANDLLQVKDSLEMGVQAAEDAEADREKLLEGSQLTLKMLNQVFERFSIEEIDPAGERFNPDYHEAVTTQPSQDQEPNTVLHVVQKGYRLDERLLRPALVVVAKQPEDSASGGGSVDETA